MKHKEEIGPAVKTTMEGIYGLKKKITIGVEYVTKCPVCEKEIEIMATTEKAKSVKCECGAIIGFQGKHPSIPAGDDPTKKKVDVESKTKEVKEDKSTNKEKEEEKPAPVHTDKLPKRKKKKRNGIIQWGMWPFRHSYTLQEGSNTIGREDDDDPSDIQIKDEYASRKSVDIVVSDSEEGYLFKFEVHKAANPIYINAHELEEGTSVYLNDGDTIRLGSTKLRFILENKK